MGGLVDRTDRELTDDEIGRIARIYHDWRGETDESVLEELTANEILYVRSLGG